MSNHISRRAFSKTLAAGLGAAALPVPAWAQATTRKLHIGHTGITWPSTMARGGGAGRAGGGGAGAPGAGAPPQGGARGDQAMVGVASGPPVDSAQLENIIRDVSGLGFWGVELFGNAVAGMEASGGIGQLLTKYNNLPLIAIVASPSITDAARLKASIDTMVSQATIAKKYGARIVLMNASGGRRDATFDFNANKANIVNALNEASKAIADLGMQAVLHQHTGTMVEKRDEVYAIMEAVDTRVVRAGFDVGQLQKGGADPVPIVRDFLPMIEHMHLKDWDGGPNWAEYCPLGMGKVDLKAILDLMETKSSMKGLVMVELDGGGANAPMTARATAETAKAYLAKLGYQFRA